MRLPHLGGARADGSPGAGRTYCGSWNVKGVPPSALTGRGGNIDRTYTRALEGA
jgi:hypothetical protein